MPFNNNMAGSWNICIQSGKTNFKLLGILIIL